MNKKIKRASLALSGFALAFAACAFASNQIDKKSPLNVYALPDANDKYTRLESIASIDENAEYVLGIDGTGFHYSGTSSWGKCALPTAQTPYYYTLTKGANNASFTAKTTISETEYYLQVPTSNTFSMATSTGTNTDLIIGTTQVN